MRRAVPAERKRKGLSARAGGRAGSFGVASPLSVGSAGSILSVLSIGSAGSILSIGSADSALSLGVGSVPGRKNDAED